MKVLIVSQYFYPENFRINTLARELVERGHSVTVLTAYPQYPIGRIYEGYGFNIPYEREWAGVKIERVKTYPRGKNPLGLLANCISYVVYANKWIKKCDEKFDAVFVFEVSPVTVGLPAVKYKEKFGTPVYFYLQDLWPESVNEVLGIRFGPLNWVINRIVNKIYTNSDKILCTSNGYVTHLIKRGVEPQKLVYWPQFCTEPNLTQAEKPAAFTDDAFHFVFTGNIGNAQGLDLLVEAAAKLKEHPIRWILVGDGRAKERIEERVKELGIEKSVVFTGRVSEQEANAYVHFADCAYLSFQDNALFNLVLPAKLQTYLACGTPVLAAAGGETAALIRDARCGVAVDPNLEALTKGVMEIISMSQKTRDEIGQAAKSYSKKYFDKDSLLDQLEEMMSQH